MMRNIFPFYWLLAWATPFLGAQEIVIDNTPSRTALFPGDRFDYRVTLRVAPGVKVALQDFEPDSVSFEPFVLMGRTIDEQTLAEGVVRYDIAYRLANYEIGDSRLEVPAIVFRYEASSTDLDAGPATREMQVPAHAVAIKSTLNAPLEESWIRESMVSPRQASYPYWLWILGGAGVALSSFPLLSWAWSKRPRQRVGSQRPGRREFAHRWEATLKGLPNQDGDVKGRYESLDRLLRDYFFYSREIEARGLTVGELKAALNDTGSPSRVEQVILEVLQHGERCRYGPGVPEEWGPVLKVDVEALRKIKI